MPKHVCCGWRVEKKQRFWPSYSKNDNSLDEDLQPIFVTGRYSSGRLPKNDLPTLFEKQPSRLCRKFKNENPQVSRNRRVGDFSVFSSQLCERVLCFAARQTQHLVLQVSQKLIRYNNQRMQLYGFGLPVYSKFPTFDPSSLDLPKSLKRANPDGIGSDEESFQPDYHYLKKLGIKVNKKKIQTGGWSALQNQIYLRFMMENINDFITQKARRTTKVFYRLSKILKRRTPDQCRSHHQKLQMKYQDDLNGIMQEVFKKIQRTIAEDFVNEQHRLHRPSFICLKEQTKTRLPEESNSQPPLQTEGKMLNFQWYGINTDENCIKIEIKQREIKEWTGS